MGKKCDATHHHQRDKLATTSTLINGETIKFVVCLLLLLGY